MAKRIHFIGICGVAMSALALAFKREGWKVTGSDVGFYPPVSTHLKDAGVNYYAGWHQDKMIAGGAPDLVVVGNVASSHNPEWLYVQEHRLNYKSYPEMIREYFIKKNSIVCAGTYGKSTSTAVLTWILKEAKFDPSYMFGGIMISPTVGAIHELPLQQGDSAGVWHAKPLPSAEMSNSNWSVTEGDEYKASRWDTGPKFKYYSPTHLLLTSVVWDHADVYPTEELYIDAFKKLVAAVPGNGIKVISEKVVPIVISIEPQWRAEKSLDPTGQGIPPLAATLGRNDSKMITYGKNPNNTYVYTNVIQSKNVLEFEICHEQKKYSIKTSCLGEYMADNLTGCFALCHTIGIASDKIISAIASFPGMKRRLEKRYANGVTVFDDIAHSPTKARAVLQTLREVYVRPLPTLPFQGEEGAASPPFKGEIQRGSRQSKIYAVFEPNAGNRRPQTKSWYDNAFAAADEVIIPRLTKIKHDTNDKEEPFDGSKLAKIICTTHSATKYIEKDEELLGYLEQKIQPGDVVVFMGSHGFRGMIEALVNAISKS